PASPPLPLQGALPIGVHETTRRGRARDARKAHSRFGRRRELLLIESRVTARRWLRTFGTPLDQSCGQGAHRIAFRIRIRRKYAANRKSTRLNSSHVKI